MINKLKILIEIKKVPSLIYKKSNKKKIRFLKVEIKNLEICVK
jgi:hypothetical protein